VEVRFLGYEEHGSFRAGALFNRQVLSPRKRESADNADLNLRQTCARNEDERQSEQQA
jgi:hypothetical protein